MFEYLRKKFGPPAPDPEPMPKWDLALTKLSHTYDALLPPEVAFREAVVKGEFSTTHKVFLVEENDLDKQLGYMALEHLFNNSMWQHYIDVHGLKDLWIDRMDLTSLVPHRGIGTALWEISHKIIKPGEYRSIVDTSDGWTQRKIYDAAKKGIFTVLDVDNAHHHGKHPRRYLVKY